MQRNEASVSIAAPPERVFAWISEPELMQRWVGGMKEFRPIDEGPAEGSRSVQVVEVAGKAWEIESVLERYEPPRALDARLTAARGFETLAAYRVEEHGDHTHLHVTMDTEFKPLAARVLGGVVRRQAQRKLDDDLARLKRLVEAEAR